MKKNQGDPSSSEHLSLSETKSLQDGAHQFSTDSQSGEFLPSTNPEEAPLRQQQQQQELQEGRSQLFDKEADVIFDKTTPSFVRRSPSPSKLCEQDGLSTSSLQEEEATSTPRQSGETKKVLSSPTSSSIKKYKVNSSSKSNPLELMDEIKKDVAKSRVKNCNIFLQHLKKSKVLLRQLEKIDKDKLQQLILTGFGKQSRKEAFSLSPQQKKFVRWVDRAGLLFLFPYYTRASSQKWYNIF